MKKIIKLQTHDGSNNHLEQYKGHVYKLVTQTDYLRGGELNNGDIFIDPSGGPMLTENHRIKGTDWIITKIEFKHNVGHLITLKNVISHN